MKNYFLGLFTGVLCCAVVWMLTEQAEPEGDTRGVSITVATGGPGLAQSAQGNLTQNNAGKLEVEKQTPAQESVTVNTTDAAVAQAPSSQLPSGFDGGDSFEPSHDFMRQYLQQERAKQGGALIAELSKRVALSPSTAQVLSQVLEKKLAADETLILSFSGQQEETFDPELYSLAESVLSVEQRAELDRVNQETIGMLAQQQLNREEIAAQLQSSLNSEQLAAFRSLERERATNSKNEMTDLMVDGMLATIPNLEDHQRDEVLRLKKDYLAQPVDNVPLGSTINMMSQYSGNMSSDAALRFFEQISQVFTPEQQAALQATAITDIEF